MTVNKACLGVDPALVPYKVLRTGDKIPAVGLGTFGSDRFDAQAISQAVETAILKGYRHIDCASVYENEKEIGAVLEGVIKGGVSRASLWLTSKVWNDSQGQGQVIQSCKQSLKDLRQEYLDLYLVHWPFPNYHAPGCDKDARSPQAQPFSVDQFMTTWRQMEELVDLGLVKNIGTSNMTKAKYEAVYDLMRIKPSVNEMELHPHFQQEDLFKWCLAHDIQPIGFCPIGSPTRPDRDKTELDTVDIEDPVVIAIAKRLQVHPALVCIKWAYQRGQIPIPFSVKPHEYVSNLEAVTKELLTQEEMVAMEKIDKNCRLIKGQVFLWPGAKDWKDIWDLEGYITK